jgi:cysteine-rich repeat protein
MRRQSLIGMIAASMTILGAMSCELTDTTVCPSGRRCPPGMQCAAAQDVCISTGCGDGILDLEAGELCDDGNIIDGDGCNRYCRLSSECGDGVRNIGEACDDGNQVSGDGCSADCLSTEICGNGYIDLVNDEECDDGGETAYCDIDCTLAYCGDGYPNPMAGEDCDRSGENTSDCNANCTEARCGDGYLNPANDEECDDGNNNNGDGCSADCKVEPPPV